MHLYQFVNFTCHGEVKINAYHFSSLALYWDFILVGNTTVNDVDPVGL